MKRLSVVFVMVGQRKGLIILGLLALLLLITGCMHIPSPFPPSGLETIAASSGSISLAWQDNAVTEDGFYVYRRSSGGYNRIAALEADATSYDDLGLEAGITYWYKVTAYNAGGESNPSEEKSVITEPDDSTHLNLGLEYAEKGMLDEAIAEFKKVIEIYPDDALAHTALGNVYYDKGMLDEAIVEWRKAIEIDPDYALAHYNLAITYYNERIYSLAIRHCDKAIELGYQVPLDLLRALEPHRKEAR